MKTIFCISPARSMIRPLLVLALITVMITQAIQLTPVQATFLADDPPGNLIITGVIDGPLTGGIPKAIELYAINDIADLSEYGLSSANNGGGATLIPEFTFPADAASAGDFIYVATESTAFNAFFGFNPNYTDGTAAAINGDDAVELFLNGSVVDVFGDVNVDGTGTAWDYMDGWAYRVDETGQDGSTFVIDNWIFSGIDALDGESTNSTAATPFPLGTYVYESGPALLITGVVDGPLSGGLPKVVEFYVLDDIADLSSYGVSSANNGAGPTGAPEFTFPADSATAGEFLYLATESTGFNAFFGFDPDYVSATAASINGDDAIELFMDGVVVDVFGDVNVDGTGTAWDYLDGWAYRVNGTGPDGSTFVISNWSFSGVDALDGETTNSTAATPFPLGTYSTGPVIDIPPTVSSTSPADNETGVALTSNITINFSEPVTVSEGWFTIACATSGTVTATVSGGPASYVLDPDTDFALSEVCEVTVTASLVVDQDGTPDAMASDYVFDFTAEAGSECGNPATLISAVQGTTNVSPLINTAVTVEAIVVADHQGSTELSGFFLQEEDTDIDGDPLSSEGVFVYHTADDVIVGDLVRLTGTVDEYFNNTQIKTITSLEICSSGNTLPTAAPLALPLAASDALEAVEGMLVEFSETLYVTETYNLGRYGEVHLSGTEPLSNPTNIAEPGPDSEAVRIANTLNRVLLDDASNVQNPATVEHLRDTGETLRIGDTVTDLTGVIYYSFDYYRIQPIGDITFTATSVRPDTAPDVGGTLKVSAFNVLNYFTTFGSRGAENQIEFDRQRDKIIAAITNLDADVIGLMEIENNGYGDETSAIDDLVDGLNDASAPGTYAFIDPGAPIGTDEIAVGLLYKPASVTPVGVTAILDSSFDPDFDDTRSRPALTQSFMEIASGETFTVVVNHLKSKGSECGVGDDDPIQGNCNLTRTKAAEVLVQWAASDPTGIGDPDFLIIGDLNAYAMEDPIDALKAGGFTDLVALYGGSDALYSYVFNGERGYLDHALSNTSMTSQVTGTAFWHINADEPRILDYNTNFGQDALGLYVDDQYRSSDHDPVVIGLNLVTLTPPTLISPAEAATVGNQSITFTWNVANGADRYTLEIRKVSDDSVVHSARYDAAVRCDISTCSVTFPGPLDLESHKWRVRSWIGTEYSDFSDYNTFDVTLAQVQLRSPGVDAIIYGGRPTLKWYPVTGATVYDVELYDSAWVSLGYWNKGVGACDPGPFCEHRIPFDLEGNYGDYHWEVRARNTDTGDEGEWSETRTFSYIQLERTWQVSPENGFITEDPSPTLQWGQITGATLYLMQIRDLSDNLIIQTLVSDATFCAAGVCTWDVDPELAIGDYKWHIRAKNGRNFGRWTAYRTITITPPTP